MPTTTPAGPGGWSGLSGPKKLAVAGAGVVGILGLIVWPTLSPSVTPVPGGPADQHEPAPISDFQPAPPPPAVQGVVSRVMADSPPAAGPAPMRVRPVPQEMSLYRANAPAVTAATQTAANGRVMSADDPFAPNPAVPTNHATLVVHPDFVIRAGDVIPCLPVDAQNSSMANFSTCRVPEWFRGSNQRRGLMPPGTRLFGSMKAGMAAGQERLGISYKLIQTPWFNMPVGTVAGDALGRGGMDQVNVETFFWDRAGAVALYALMDTTVGIGQGVGSSMLNRSLGSANGGGTTLNIQGASQSLAGKEFDATINRPPVGTRDQALPVTATVGQDLDFYAACMMALRSDPNACPVLSQ